MYQHEDGPLDLCNLQVLSSGVLLEEDLDSFSRSDAGMNLCTEIFRVRLEFG